jgi:hypothetical protein
LNEVFGKGNNIVNGKRCIKGFANRHIFGIIAYRDSLYERLMP